MTQQLDDHSALRVLRDSEKQLRLLVENTSDVIIALDKELRVAYVSPSVRRVFGYTPYDLLGHGAFGKIHADDAKRVQRLLKIGVRRPGTGAALQFRFCNERGEWRWVEAVGNNLLHDARVHAIVVNVRDITDRKLSEQRVYESEQLYRTVFESVSDGLRLSDLKTDQTVEVNAAWIKMHGYTRDEAMALTAKDLVPSAEFLLHADDWMETIRSGGTVRGESFNSRKDGTIFPVDVRAQNASVSGRSLALTIARDITEQSRAMDLLERRVGERTHELSTLLAVSQILSSTLELQPLAQLVADHVGSVVEHRSVYLFLIEPGDRLRLMAHNGGITPEVMHAFQSWPLAELDKEVVRKREAIIIPDLREPTPYAQLWHSTRVVRLPHDHKEINSWVSVPLVVRDHVIGLIVLDHDTPGYYTPQRAELVRAFANQAAAAIENARLYREEQRRLHESERRRVVAEGLRDILRVLNSSRSLDESLEAILSRACELLDTDTAAIFKLDPQLQVLNVQVAHGLPSDYVEQAALPLGKGAVGRAALTQQPVISVPPHTYTFDDFADLPQQRDVLGAIANRMACMLAVPLLVKDETYGALMLYYQQSREFNDEDIELAKAVGDQAALAIENARLRTDAARMATVAERSRLARELHDSVSQALYGIALGTRTARELLNSSPERAAEPLDYVLSLVQGGLAEMRALIFELRPESLASEGLIDAFKRQVDALGTRHGLSVSFDADEEPPLSLKSKEALYRIALEAIQNTIKHARATHVRINLARTSDVSNRQCAELWIEDDGRGFDPEQSFPGHMGLHSMRERAEGCGGTLQVISAPDAGACIRVCIPLDEIATSETRAS
jgi:PAS domain S-box-containing protein